MTLQDLRTPFAFLDATRVRANIQTMAQRADAARVRLRPHAKTHKSIEIARWQIEAGAVGICCAKLGEAEVFADAGFTDIRLPYHIHPSNADRVVALLDRTRLSFIVDHLGVAQQWSEAMVRAGREVDILVSISMPGEAPLIEAVPKWANFDLPGHNMPFNVTGQPAISVCCGFGETGLTRSPSIERRSPRRGD